MQKLKKNLQLPFLLTIKKDIAIVAIVAMNRSMRKDIAIFIERFIATILTKSELLLGVIFRSDAVIWYEYVNQATKKVCYQGVRYSIHSNSLLLLTYSLSIIIKTVLDMTCDNKIIGCHSFRFCVKFWNTKMSAESGGAIQ